MGSLESFAFIHFSYNSILFVLGLVSIPLENIVYGV